MAATGFGGAIAPTPLVRSWRTSFLTLRDETLTNLPRTSTPQLLNNLIFSHSHTLLCAAPELPSHEVLSDILFMMELVASTSSDQEDCIHIYTQTSRLIHDICRHVKFDINSSSFSSVLGCFRKMLVRFLGKNATGDELIGISRTAAIVSAVECLHAIRCIITQSHRRWLQSEDTILVKFLVDVIVSFQESSSSELQTIAFEMLSEAISRAGPSFPVDIWRSMLEVVRKTMDVMALKTPVVEDNAMSRFYESFLTCLHLILTDPKCSVSDHVSVFVAVLRMFLNYGLSGRTPITLLVGHSKKDLNNVSPKAHKEQLNKSNHSVYRPPHLRKRDCSNVNPNRATSSQYISDSESSTINVTSSDSDFSDGDGSAKESARVQNSRIRVAAIICIQVNSKFAVLSPF
ncbi:hypothetical protein QL285_062187 [Trifolium repens]|nr:hypothetical protein QL285_062187 [Trifolium repens]